ncbi:hypothetical protein chiPu_0003283 [Chiloscyllium punctatum]|uniref:Uncharacterized protein n=1 Tax=Chiloscyllium punctatum TaxID=137246 RepID=A0A401S3B4_CHIPU|nr:hypothetical protein [Chiloscyllium punctatum]
MITRPDIHRPIVYTNQGPVRLGKPRPDIEDENPVVEDDGDPPHSTNNHNTNLPNRWEKEAHKQQGTETSELVNYIKAVIIEPSFYRTALKEVLIYYPMNGLFCMACNSVLPTVGTFREHLPKTHHVKTFRTKCSKCDKSGEYHAIM